MWLLPIDHCSVGSFFDSRLKSSSRLLNRTVLCGSEMKDALSLGASLIFLCACPSAWTQDASPTPTPLNERVIDPVAIGGPRPIDRDDAHARKYVKELTWSLSGDPAIAGTEDGVALWNLAQKHQEQLNLQTVIDVSAYGNRSFAGAGEINQTYTYAFMSAYTAKLEGKEPAVQRLDQAGSHQ
jgi:hypothetical protein